MATKKRAAKKTGKVIRVPVAAARHWRKGQPIPKAMKEEIERQVEEYTRKDEEQANAQLTAFCGPKHFNVTELLYAVTGYLSTREKPLTFSRYHDASPIAEILGALVKANNLPETTKNWPKIKIPDGIDAITNSSNQVTNAVLPDIQEAVKQLLSLIFSYDSTDQNIIIATVLQRIKTTREAYLKALRGNQEGIEADLRRTFDNIDAIDKIGRGDLLFIPKGLL